ncbi:MAG: alpha/beta hydrolase, partial [Thermodesulfobacteriota bacterium]
MQDLTFSGPDGDFHYLDWGGRGPLAHIAHATGFCARIYTPLAERLKEHLHVIGLDDRGHGRTRAPADPRRLEDWMVFARDLELFLESQGRPVVAMGHSRGGVVSLLLAVLRPDLIRALVLIDPTILPFSWMWWWFLAKKFGLARLVPIAARAARRRDSWPDRAAVLASFRQKKPFSDWAEGFLEGYVADGVTENDDGTVRLSCHPAWESRTFATCSHDIWRYAARLTQPTLFLYGRHSDVCLPAAAKRFGRVQPDTAFLRLDQVGHFVPMERPEQTVRAILDFLDAHEI